MISADKPMAWVFRRLKERGNPWCGYRAGKECGNTTWWVYKRKKKMSDDH